ATENERGRCISYRIAKSALNQQTVTIANELKAAGSKIVMIVVDPGDVPTRLIRGNGKTDIDKSVRGIVEIIESATLISQNSFPFMREEAAVFLARLTAINANSNGDSENALILSDRLGGFPLALVHVAAIIRRKDLTMNEMLERYDDRAFDSEIYNFTELSPQDKYTQIMSTVWELEDLGNPSLHLLAIIVSIDPDAIDESIVKMRLDKYPSEDFRKQLTVHRVVQEGTRDRMLSQKFTLVFGHVIELLLKAWYHEPGEKFTHLRALWDIANLVSPHATYVKSISDRRGPDLDPDITSAFARLLQKNGWSLFETGYPNSAQPLLELALRLCDGIPSKTYSDFHGQDKKVLLADVLFCLVSLPVDHNQPVDALRYTERHFEVRMTELGLGYVLNERFEDAIVANRAGGGLLVELPLFKEGRNWPDLPSYTRFLPL
ncbi:MAG: hypothetical protein L6R38_005343, partial [Xanthoria sp. 2 TBL-2021]